MLFTNHNGSKQRATPGARASCPTCGGGTIAKCGTLVSWHWAHARGHDCDPWAEPIGPWHLPWQEIVRPEFAEVVLGPHRADIVGNADVVIELQHSPIDEEQVGAREAFYSNMIWLFDATYRFAGIHSGDRYFFSYGRTKHLGCCQKPVHGRSLCFNHRDNGGIRRRR